MSVGRKPPGALAVACCVMLAGCAAPEAANRSPSADPSTPAKQVLAAIRSAPSLSQATISSGGPQNPAGLDELQALVAAGLTHIDSQGALQPQLAKGVPSTENALWKILPDGRMETSWEIKEAAYWQDGTPVTSADLVFTMEVEQDRELPIVRNEIYNLIEAVDAPDSRRIVITWKRPYIAADSTFTFTGGAVPLPRHLLEGAYRESKTGFMGLAYWSQEFIGAGPYKVRDWVPDSHVILDAFDRYVLGRPKIQTIQLKFIPSPDTLLANILSGQVELLLGRGLGFEQSVQLEREWRAGSIHWKRSGWYKILPQFINPNPVVVTDLRFRQALMYATNRQELIDTLYMGKSSIAESLVPPDAPEFSATESSIVRYEFAPRRAVQLIESTGHTRGPEGLFSDPAGKRLSLELRTTTGLADQAPLTTAIGDYWKQVGVDIQLNFVPPELMVDREYRAKFPAFEMVSIGLGLLPGDIGRWHSSRTPLPENDYTAGNTGGYKSADFDALVERYMTTIPRDVRTQALAGIVRHQTEQLNIMGLFYTVGSLPVGNRLLNVSTPGRRGTTAWNAHEWDISS